MAFSGIDGKTDYHFGLVACTDGDASGLEIKHPAHLRLVFDDRAPIEAQLGGDWMVVRTHSGIVRAALLDAWHLLVEGSCRVQREPSELRIRRQGQRTLVGSALQFDPALIEADLEAAIRLRQRWLERIALPIHAAHRPAVAKALTQMKTQVLSPQGMIRHRWTTPDRWPHRDMWLWDSAFHAIGFRHVDPVLAGEMIEAVLDVQTDDGFVPHQASPEQRTQVTQPPILTMATDLVIQAGGDPELVSKLYDQLCRYVGWDLEHRDRDGAGLCEWQIDPADQECPCGESGMDNSPRFDSRALLDATDFNTFLALECETLSRFAKRLQHVEESERWRDEHARLCQMINQRLWNDGLGFYMDYDPEAGRQTEVMASAGFLPMICGAPSNEQVLRLEAHLSDPRTFGTAFPVASIAACDSRYRKDMWRGPTWINVNWLIARGFERYGRRETAERIRLTTIDMVEKYYGEFGTFFEFYDDRDEVAPRQLSRKGHCNPSGSVYHQVISDYGWTATLYLDMVMAMQR